MKEWDSFIAKHNKKDDLSDCFLQGLWRVHLLLTNAEQLK